MKALKVSRMKRKFSQRQLARLAGLSYKTIQLMETEGHNTRLHSLAKVLSSFGYPSDFIEEHISAIFQSPPESIWVVSSQIERDGEDSYKFWLFDFVDTFRRDPKPELIDVPPWCHSDRILALLASTVESVCDEAGMSYPWWTLGVSALDKPWFLSGVENLKTMALRESPIHFRKRNIFVLDNFLERR